MPELSAPAKKLAGKIIDELRGRKGFDHLFDDLDAGIKKELKQSLAGICEEALADRYQRLKKRIDEKSDMVAASDLLHPSFQVGYLQALDFVLRQLDDLGDF